MPKHSELTMLLLPIHPNEIRSFLASINDSKKVY